MLLTASYTIVRLVRTLFNFYSFLILAYCLLTWFPIRPGGLLEDIGYVLQRIVGPYLGFFRKFIPPMAGIDWSPVLAIVVLNLIENVLIGLLL